ncbi:MAG: 7-carboxy-7-deazaguanine synthase QueE [Gammaproteobacteria bacterium]|nr:7-carboxy-7-deazaguanine synthase QueE [Gammaproteobacteria bacterium]
MNETTQDRLRITEIFNSLQGESRSVGWPTVFVRLTGCPLRCVYCDSAYAFQGGEWMSIDDIVAKVATFHSRYVTVTGGEPLAQKRCASLLERLCDKGYEVSLETSGALDICGLDSRVVRVVDVKTPSSGEQDKNLWSNMACLTAQDQVKFVIMNADDYVWSLEVLKKYGLEDRCEVLFSPVHGDLKPVELADWILRDGLKVRFQMQLHKLLWGDEPGR